MYVVVLMLHVCCGKEVFIVILAGVLSFFGKFGLSALTHVVGNTSGPLDHLGISSKGRRLIGNDLEYGVFVHTGTF